MAANLLLTLMWLCQAAANRLSLNEEGNVKMDLQTNHCCRKDQSGRLSFLLLSHTPILTKIDEWLHEWSMVAH